jgi:NAD(P)-dependent dehydrogenase (short-subunit alcohol dehydrogenase family)
MKGKRVLITGGNAGIGKATAIALAKMGAEIIITARSEGKAKEAVTEIVKASGSDAVTYLLLDLSSQHEVRNAAQVFKARYDRLDVLINNAGCYFSDLQLNTDGLEMQFATNHLGHFLFTNLVLDELKAAPKSPHYQPIVHCSQFNSRAGFERHQLPETTLSGLEKLLTVEVLQYPFHQRTGNTIGRHRHHCKCGASGRCAHGDSREERQLVH